MCKNTLDDIFEEVHKQDFEEFDNAPRHRFSRRHRCEISKILTAGELQPYTPKKVSVRKRIMVACLVVLLALISAAAGAAVVNSFTAKQYSNHTEIFTSNADVCPKLITDVYYIPKMPDDYELVECVKNPTCVNTKYRNKKTGEYATFDQSVKENYDVHFDNVHHRIEELQINGQNALFFHSKNAKHKSDRIVWDCGDYVLEIFGDFPQEELIELAESVKVA